MAIEKLRGCGGDFFIVVLNWVDHVGWRAGPAELAEEAGSGEAVQECFEIEVRSDRHLGFLSKRKSRSLRDEKQKHGLALVYASVTARRRGI